jgi:hypothetical protein
MFQPIRILRNCTITRLRRGPVHRRQHATPGPESIYIHIKFP